MWYLCSGKTCAKPSAFSIDSATAELSSFFESPKLVASRILVPISNFWAVSLAIASASPVTIFILTPIFTAVAMVSFASSRGGSKSGSTPTNCHCPSPSARATPKARKPLAAKSLTALLTAGFTCERFADNAKITCGAPLVTLNVFPSFDFTSASVRL